MGMRSPQALGLGQTGADMQAACACHSDPSPAGEQWASAMHGWACARGQVVPSDARWTLDHLSYKSGLNY